MIAWPRKKRGSSLPRRFGIIHVPPVAAWWQRGPYWLRGGSEPGWAGGRGVFTVNFPFAGVAGGVLTVSTTRGRMEMRSVKSVPPYRCISSPCSAGCCFVRLGRRHVVTSAQATARLSPGRGRPPSGVRVDRRLHAERDPRRVPMRLGCRWSVTATCAWQASPLTARQRCCRLSRLAMNCICRQR